MTIYTADIVKQDILTFPASTDTWNVVTFYVNTSYLTLSCTSELPFVIGTEEPGFEFNKAEMYFSPDGVAHPPADRTASLHVEMMQTQPYYFPVETKRLSTGFLWFHWDLSTFTVAPYDTYAGRIVVQQFFTG